jgi:cytochrome b
MGHIQQVKVWDPLVRTFHWSLVVLFTLAYVTGDDAETAHIWFGYIVLALLLLRVLWGLVGTQHARFSDFVYPVTAILSYTKDMLLGRARRYLGHNPLGGAMIMIMLVVLLLTCVTGIVAQRADQQDVALTPAQPAIATIDLVPAAWADDDRFESREAHAHDKTARKRNKALREAHEFFANLMLLLVVMHIGGVLLGSLMHRENLVRAMLDGRKRGEASSQI